MMNLKHIGNLDVDSTTLQPDYGKMIAKNDYLMEIK